MVHGELELGRRMVHGGGVTKMLTGEQAPPPQGPGPALRYIRDRVNVPRDMPLWAARRVREALGDTADLEGGGRGREPIPTRHRKDQDPRSFFGSEKTRL